MSAPKLFRAEYFIWLAPIVILVSTLQWIGYPHLRVSHQHRATFLKSKKIRAVCEYVGFDLRDKLRWHLYTPADGHCPLVRLIKAGPPRDPASR